MTKFVASVIAGLIATVLGGLILHHLTNSQGQKAVPHVAAPTPDPPDIDFTAPSPPKDARWFATYAEAERTCGSGNFWRSPDHGPNAGRYFCHRNSNWDTTRHNGKSCLAEGDPLHRGAPRRQG